LNCFYSFHADGTHHLIAQSVIYPAIFLNVKVDKLVYMNNIGIFDLTATGISIIDFWIFTF